jgi:amidase
MKLRWGKTDPSANARIHGRRDFIKKTTAAGLLGAIGIPPSLTLPAELSPQSSVTKIAPGPFRLEEATITDVHRAFLAKQLTAVSLVQMYLKRIEAYNGVCVRGAVDPATGLQLGEITPIEDAGQINALISVNIRGRRSKTDLLDNDPSMPDALEVAHSLDAYLARTGRLMGPLHGIPMAVKDLFDTRDMRTTNGADALYANDRPPRDCEVVARLRAAGAIILGKANEGDYANGDRSTYGGTSCNPYDTTRSPGRSSGGPGAAVAANLVMCAIGEETGQSVRNPAANENLVGMVPTFGLVSRVGMMPWTIAQDRAGVLSRTIEDGATVLGVVAGYDPKDPFTAGCFGRMPHEPYRSFAQRRSLKGVRLGIVREFMQRINKADDDSISIAEQAIEDLRRLGATVVDPGPDGQIFSRALAECIPSYDGGSLVASFPDAFTKTNEMEDLIALSLDHARMPSLANIRWYVANAFPNDGSTFPSGETTYVMDRYLKQRGDGVIHDVKSLAAHSTSYYTPPVYHVPSDTKSKLDGLVVRRETLYRKDNGAPVTIEVPIEPPNMAGFFAGRAVLNALVLKVMADDDLDALVYPMKTIPAAILAAPIEPTNLKTVMQISTVTIDGVEYLRKTERVLAERNPLGTELCTNAGLPAIVVPAGFTNQIYDRAVIVGKDGSKMPGELEGPKPIALPVGLEFMGRQLSEPLLIGIAAAYEAATHHRRSPKSFGRVPGEYAMANFPV